MRGAGEGCYEYILEQLAEESRVGLDGGALVIVQRYDLYLGETFCASGV
jgi:hypothetical protein